MKRLWKGTLGLSLGFLITGTSVAEPPWRAVATSNPNGGIQTPETIAICPPAQPAGTPSLATGQPGQSVQPPASTNASQNWTVIASSVAAAKPKQPATVPQMPPIFLGRPVVVQDRVPSPAPAAMIDNHLRPVTYSQTATPDGLIARSQAPDTPRPLPSGPSLGGDASTDPPPAATKEQSKEKKPAKPAPLNFTKPAGSTPGTPTSNPATNDGREFLSPPAGSDASGNNGNPLNVPMPKPVPVPSGLPGQPNMPIMGGNPCTTCPDPNCCTDSICQPMDGCGDPELNAWLRRGYMGPNYRFYAGAEYLLWWMKGSSIPPLVTSGSPNDALPGALGQPGTNVLFGGRSVGINDPRSGGRFTMGYWFNDQHTLGLEGSFFFLGQSGVNFATSSPGSAVLARPFFNANSGAQDAELVSYPGLLSGGVTARVTNQLWGYETNLRTHLCSGCWYNVDLIGGFRYINFNEDLYMSEALQTITPSPSPTSFQVNDAYRTRNQFYGGQIGAISEFRYNRWFLDLTSKIAFGDMHEVVNINGNTTVSNPGLGVNAFYPGGLLALPSNIGTYSRNEFAVIPEIGVNLGYQITTGLRVFVGYNLLFLSNIVRPGDQVNQNINITQIPPGTLQGPALPSFAFHGSDFWAQGVNFGLQWRY